MPLELRVEGVRELMRAIENVARAGYSREAKEIYIEAGRIVYDEARRRAPYNPRRKRGTHLRDALFLGPGPAQKPDVLVGVNMRKAPHAWLVEYGRRGWSGHPYWRPALESSRPAVLALISERMMRLIANKFGGE